MAQTALGQDNHGLNTTRSLLLLVPNALPLVGPGTPAAPERQLLGNKVVFVGTNPSSAMVFGYQRSELVVPGTALQSHASFRDIRLSQLPQGPAGGGASVPSSSGNGGGGSSSGQPPQGEAQWPAAGPLPQSAAAAAAAATQGAPRLPRRLLQQGAAGAAAGLPPAEQFALLLWSVERWVGEGACASGGWGCRVGGGGGGEGGAGVASSQGKGRLNPTVVGTL